MCDELSTLVMLGRTTMGALLAQLVELSGVILEGDLGEIVTLGAEISPFTSTMALGRSEMMHTPFFVFFLFYNFHQIIIGTCQKCMLAQAHLINMLILCKFYLILLFLFKVI